ncbi:hypothetical protein Tco_1436268, partial [Tanacetum coccineum]
MARFVCLEELCVAANSRLVVDAMLVYFQRDTARDMQYATDLTKLWQELADRVSERDLFIAEMELLSGSLVASSCDQEELICYADAESVKWLWYGEWA